MNKVILIGRLARDPDVRYTQGEEQKCMARYTLAVDRPHKKEGQQSADFISCVAFGKSGDFTEMYLRKGMKIAVTGRIQTGSYTNKEGAKIYTTDVVIESQEFCESKAANDKARQQDPQEGSVSSDGFMDIPEELEDGLPFR